MVDGKENYKFGLGVRGLRLPVHFVGLWVTNSLGWILT